MKRAALAVAAALMLAAGVLLPACPAARDGFPDKACKTNADCFQGETCVMMVCVGNNDLAMPDMALPIVDFSQPEAGDDL